mmetsp:Transcript_19008/g.25781  ORF Transcript_19008/g.25781 Transcript_19008/m.25781 type:complete len:102 (+) Transcript_19008:346-651(+)
MCLRSLNRTTTTYCLPTTAVFGGSVASHVSSQFATFELNLCLKGGKKGGGLFRLLLQQTLGLEAEGEFPFPEVGLNYEVLVLSSLSSSDPFFVFTLLFKLL